MAKKNDEANNMRHSTVMQGAVPYRLTNDYMFRAVMQKNKNVLKHLICAIMGIDPDNVTDLDICNPIELGEKINSKTCVLNIKLLLNKKQYINIEMQVVKQIYWKERSLTYLCRTYNNLDEGADYADALPALQISILDFDLFDGVEELLSKYYLINENPQYHNRYLDDFGIFVLNLRQIDNENVTKNKEHSQLYQWARLFRAESWEELHMLAEQNEAIDECVYTMAQLSEDEKIRMQCEARKDNLAIEIGIRKRAMREGREEGWQEGLQEGLQEGHKQAMLEVAKNLLDVLDKPTIAEKTGLSICEIEALEK
ncbi:MAG: Rpn family recombination-promoting nuclease/putative transposase [Clostridium sp.]|nr:Rpn family recombination-promoting nuclease/putative transposase [Clostridium sp.]